jgi:uncharacterized protein YihD (DUF1040 family)
VPEPRDLWALLVDPADSRRKQLTYIRALAAVEDEELRDAADLLHHMTEGSGLKRVRDAANDVLQSVLRLESSTDSAEIPAFAREIQRDFKSWLSAFRAVDDQTSVWLSRRFGSDSEHFNNFKVSLSTEYDANFAYRLCSTLRNASQHADDVLIGSGVERGVDGTGRKTNRLKMLLDPVALCREFPMLKAAVRNELLTFGQPLSVPHIMGEVAISTQRIHCRLVLDLWPALQPAVELCDRLAKEAITAGGTHAVLLNSGAFLGPDQKSWTHSFEYSPKNLADVVVRNKNEEALPVLMTPVQYIGPEDLVERGQ